jgi:hypothetical protein
MSEDANPVAWLRYVVNRYMRIVYYFWTAYRVALKAKRSRVVQGASLARCQLG